MARKIVKRVPNIVGELYVVTRNGRKLGHIWPTGDGGWNAESRKASWECESRSDALSCLE